MNIWTQKSIDLANQKNYLDLLYKVYPMSNNLKRQLTNGAEEKIESAFDKKDNEELLNLLLDQDLFPIKDSYVAYLKRDRSSIKRNPSTVERISGMLYEMGVNEIINKCTAPKETNRQIGPLFKRWINQGCLGCKVTEDEQEFLDSDKNIVLNASDEQMKEFAKKYLGYTRDKGLDFIGKFNNIIVIGEAKFLTDFGGHQNAQFADAMSTLTHNLKETKYKVIKIAILDGVVYIKSNNKMHKEIQLEYNPDEIIISSVLLRDFLYSL